MKICKNGMAWGKMNTDYNNPVYIEKQRNAKLGDKNPNWKGGISYARKINPIRAKEYFERNYGKNGKYIPCLICNKEKYVRPSFIKKGQGKFCSYRCRGIWDSAHKIGINHPCWKGGLSLEPYTVDWTETLKISIRKRDKYTCQICGKEPSVYVHHVDYIKKNCSPDNLITLCASCHAKTNTKREYWKTFFHKGGDYY